MQKIDPFAMQRFHAIEISCPIEGLRNQIWRRLDLAGKPAPDMFLEATRRLNASPARTVVFEDATASVEAARSGNFGLVIGVGSAAHALELLGHGADAMRACIFDAIAISKIMAPANTPQSDGKPNSDITLAASGPQRVRFGNLRPLTLINEGSALVINT